MDMGLQASDHGEIDTSKAIQMINGTQYIWELKFFANRINGYNIEPFFSVLL